VRDKIREVKFKQQTLKFVYRDDSDISVIDEFFVDKMYKATEYQISNIKYPILDIGAHIGVFSIYASVINPKCQIFALEPEPANFELLKDNLKLNHTENVKVIRAALVSGDELNTNLYLSKNTHNHSTVSLRGGPDPSYPLGTSYAISSSITVPAINLERLIKEQKIKQIGLLKMDIEGAEFDIISNIKYPIFNHIQNLVVEYHESNNHKRPELETLIRSHGFSVEHFPNKFDKRFGLLVCRNKR